jgi:hypothetical protein
VKPLDLEKDDLKKRLTVGGFQLPVGKNGFGLNFAHLDGETKRSSI